MDPLVYHYIMELIICEDEEQFVQTISDWCRTQIQKCSAHSIFIPAGKTPESLYRHWELVKPDYLRNIKLLQIDDILTGGSQFLFRKFFENSLPSYQSKIQWIGDGEDVGDLAILGLGLNGHVAFHEPGIDQSLFSGCVLLGKETCSNLGLNSVEWGITYGLSAFKNSKAILLIVKGSAKKKILSRLLAKDPMVPATHLLQHSQVTIIVDKEAYGD